MNKIHVVLVDDHKLFRDGVHRLLEMETDIVIDGEASNGLEGLNLVKQVNPDILLFDINMPEFDGIQLIRELEKENNLVKSIAITAYQDERRLSELSAVGVNGFVLKSSGRVELLSAIRSVFRDQSYIDPKVASILLGVFQRKKSRSDHLYELSSREKEVLFWIAQGMSNGEIAMEMVLSEKTIKNHVSHILKKLDLRDRTQAAIKAWQIGFAQGQFKKTPVKN